MSSFDTKMRSSYRSHLDSLPEVEDENTPDPGSFFKQLTTKKHRKRVTGSPVYDNSLRPSRRNNSRYSGDFLDCSTDVFGSNRSARIINTSRNSGGDLLDTSNNASGDKLQHSSDSLEGGSSQVKRNDKRYRICQEMLETEKNYLNMLKIMVNCFKTPLEELVDQPNEILTKQEILMLFSKVQSLIHCHEISCDGLQQQIDKWPNSNEKKAEVLIGRVWNAAIIEFKKIYPPYVNSYDSIVVKLNELQHKKPAFAKFVREVENRPECKKNSLNDMLIRPVQRLPSILLLLRELLKKTAKSNPDYNWIDQCISSLEDTLKEVNESRAKSESADKLLRIMNSIEDFPEEYRSSSRTFIGDVDLVLLIASGGQLKSVQGRVVTFFLFNDFIAIAKQRSKVDLNNSFRSNNSVFSTISTMSTMTLPKMTSTKSSWMGFSKKKERKNYKLAQLVKFYEIRDFDCYKDQGIFQMKIREEKGDELCIFQVVEEYLFDAALEFFRQLIDIINSDSPARQLAIEDLTDDKIEALKNSRPEEYEYFIRAKKTAQRFGDESTPEPRTSSLRRAVSNVSLSKTFRGITRFASRSSLSHHKANLNHTHLL